MIAGLFDHLWQSTLFAACAGLLTLALRRNRAALRYRIWFAASMKFLLPFALLTAAGAHLAIPAPAPAAEPAPAAAPLYWAAQSLALAARAPEAAVTPAPGTATFMLLPALFGLWAVGCIAVLASWGVRWRRVARVLRDARPCAVTAPIPVRVSASTLEPGVVGIWRPVLLLPEGLADHLTPAELDAVLAHELRHLHRRDNLTAAMHMLVEALFWFHPLVWWLGARLIEARERACDEAVVEAGADPKVYAGAILKVCRLYVQSPLPCAAGISGADLKQRVETIMTTPLAVRLSAAKTLMLAGCAAAAIAAPLAVGMLASAPATAQAQGEDAPLPPPAEIARRKAEQEAPRKIAPLDPKQFDRFVGYYQVGPNARFTISRDGNRFLLRLTGQQDVEIYPESSTKFFATVVAAQVSFVTDGSGKATALVLHQGGLEQTAKRIDANAAKAMDDALARRIKNNTPSPGTAEAVRRRMLSYEKGQPDYNDMTPRLAAAVREQWPDMQKMAKRWGPLKAIHFDRVGAAGNDLYKVEFQNARVMVTIAPLTPSGKIAGMMTREW